MSDLTENRAELVRVVEDLVRRVELLERGAKKSPTKKRPAR